MSELLSIRVIFRLCGIWRKMIFPQDNGIGFGAFLDVPILYLRIYQSFDDVLDLAAPFFAKKAIKQISQTNVINLRELVL